MELWSRIQGEGPVVVIAEAGVNHDGSADDAHELVELAARTGADAVKFQTFRVDALTSTDAASAGCAWRVGVRAVSNSTKAASSSVLPVESATARSMMFSNSRTLPGKL